MAPCRRICWRSGATGGWVRRVAVAARGKPYGAGAWNTPRPRDCGHGSPRVCYFSRRFDEVPGQCQRLLELDPASFAAHWGLTFAYAQSGMHEESWTALARGFSVIGWLDAAEVLERGHRARGYAGAMRDAALTLEQRRQKHYVSPVMIASLFALAEERKSALEWLDRAFGERAPLLVYLKVAPYWDSIRSEPRFGDLVGRMGFAPPAAGP